MQNKKYLINLLTKYRLAEYTLGTFKIEHIQIKEEPNMHCLERLVSQYHKKKYLKEPLIHEVVRGVYDVRVEIDRKGVILYTFKVKSLEEAKELYNEIIKDKVQVEYFEFEEDALLMSSQSLGIYTDKSMRNKVSLASILADDERYRIDLKYCVEQLINHENATYI